MPESKSTRHVFGPVPSRRLGRSLGVDLVPLKTCSFDCIYCQLGRTTCKTIEIREYVPLDEVIQNVREKLSTSPDYITLSGSGEPMLYSRLGEIIEAIKNMTSIPVAILTNGSLLWMPQMRRAIMGADLVVPSLDAGNEKQFQYINRPHENISFDRFVEGLISFRNEYSGSYWLEVFFLEGLNSTEFEANDIMEITKRIEPDLIQLNTVARPPTEDYAKGVSREDMLRLAALFGDKAEVIADFSHVHDQPLFKAASRDVAEMIARRPCSINDIAEGLGIHVNEAIKHVEELIRRGEISAVNTEKGIYYRTV